MHKATVFKNIRTYVSKQGLLLIALYTITDAEWLHLTLFNHSKVL